MRNGYQTVAPYLVCRDAAKAIDFYKKNLGAEEVYKLASPDGKIMHAEIQISECRIMISDEFTDADILSPLSLDGTPVSLNIYVEDVDKVFNNMLEDDCAELSPLQDQFHGDRSGKLRDPFGHVWHIATNIEDKTPKEIEALFAQMMSN